MNEQENDLIGLQPRIDQHNNVEENMERNGGQ